jgi:predicted lipid-binding transport protein (Tim44 family)
MGDPILDPIRQQQEPVTPPIVPADQPKPPKEPGKFGRILGGVLGGAVNVIAPGAGSILGGLIRGGGAAGMADMEVMLAQSARQQTQLLGVQMRVNDQTQQFTAVSNLLKSKHDGEMSAVSNFKTS